jgi:hypothetical protein
MQFNLDEPLKLIVDNDRKHAAIELSGSMLLRKGYYKSGCTTLMPEGEGTWK